jgi:probable O-glycosylation ligase (exosortase A-associated)
MPYKPQSFDYEPVTRRRSARLPEKPEDDEQPFVVSRRPRLGADADDAARFSSETNLQPPVREETQEEETLGALSSPELSDSNTRRVKPERSVLRRGHTLSFVGLFLFTVVLYFRPYEMFPALASLRSLAYWIAVSTLLIFVPSQLGLEGNLTTRPREVNLILLLSLCALLSVPLAMDRAEAWSSFVEFLKVVVMFIVMVNVVRTQRRLRILLFLSLAVGCVVSAGAINDYRLGHFTVAGDRIAGIIGGMFANANDMALHLVMMTPISIALFFGTRSIIKKAFYGAFTAIMVVGNVVTFSRGGLLGLVAAMAVILWKLGRRHRLLVFVLALSLAFSLVAFMPGTMVERLSSIFDPTSDVSGGASAISRRALLFRSLLVMSRHPLLGVGMGNFHSVSIHEQVSHNAYTQVGAELGIAAMLLYIMLITTAFKRMRGIERETPEAKQSRSSFYYLSVALQASLVGYMVCSFFISVAFQHYIYYLLGYAVCLHRIYETNKPAIASSLVEEESRGKSRAGGKRRWRASLPEHETAPGL